MNSSRKLFFMALGFSFFLSMFYFSYSQKHIPAPDRDVITILNNEKYLERQKEAEEKMRIEAKVRKEYEDVLSTTTPLPVPYITHYFDKRSGNITVPIQKPFLFLHVPKTAGSTLSAVFKRNEKPSKFLHTWAQPKYNDMARVALKDTVFGHFRYGLHFYFNRNCTYMTVLREPIDRVVSHYYYHRQHKKDPGHIFAMNHTFDEWIRLSPAGNNDQTRSLSGIRSEFNISKKTLDMAMHHLRRMAIVGLTEEYHETLMLLKYIAGFTIVKYRPVNKGVKRPKVDDVPEATIELIKKHNWADIELYKLGKEIFEKQLSVMPPQYHKDLKQFDKLMTKKRPKF